MRQTWGKNVAILIAFAVMVLPLLQSTPSSALIQNRKLTLMAAPSGSPPDGGSKPSGVNVEHEFSFNTSVTGDIGSIRFEYCTTTEGACTVPTGLNTSSATLASETGSQINGFTINNSTAGKPYVTRTAANVNSGQLALIRLGGITNPSTVGTFFVRINVYTQAALGGTVLDSGVVAASTAQSIELTGTMPESLIFCTGGTVAANCASTTSGAVSFNQLFSPTDTAIASSQMAASTNAAQGYTITVNGPTLTNGTATIPGYSSATALTSANRGSSGWGMNLRANTAAVSAAFPGNSAEIASASDGTDLKGQALAGYNTTDTFKFVSGDPVANSASTGGALGTVGATLGPTNSQTYTASYVVNVAGNQLAGTYTSTLTYICTPTF
jgi:hypothetical protein